MKKFLLSLCLTMLSVVGVWAQTYSFTSTAQGNLYATASDEDGAASTPEGGLCNQNYFVKSDYTALPTPLPLTTAEGDDEFAVKDYYLNNGGSYTCAYGDVYVGTNTYATASATLIDETNKSSYYGDIYVFNTSGHNDVFLDEAKTQPVSVGEKCVLDKSYFFAQMGGVWKTGAEIAELNWGYTWVDKSTGFTATNIYTLADGIYTKISSSDNYGDGKNYYAVTFNDLASDFVFPDGTFTASTVIESITADYTVYYYDESTSSYVAVEEGDKYLGEGKYYKEESQFEEKTPAQLATLGYTKANYAVLTKEGDTVVLTVHKAGAFDGTNFYSPDGTTLQELKDAANVKVVGSLKNSDVKALINQIGEATGLTDPANVCKSLDMGEATMAEGFVLNDDGSWKKESWFASIFEKGLWYLEDLTFPQPATGNTVIPTGMNGIWNSSAMLFQSLTIPEGWTEIANNAFVDATTKNGVKSLSSLTLPNSITRIGNEAFRNAAIESLVLPSNLISVGEYAFADNQQLKTLTSNDITEKEGVEVVIEKYAFSGAIAMKTVVMPANLVEVKDHAFNDMEVLDDMTFNDKLAKIGAYAFFNIGVVALDMPLKIDRIDEYAFGGEDLRLQDVYFYGPAPTFVHTHAFSGKSQMANNTVDDSKVKGYDPTITRFEYKNADVLVSLLHYPAQYKSQYVDETRIYDILPETIEYGKGNTTYYPEGWTQAIIDEVMAHRDHYSDATASLQVDYGIKDAYYGYDLIWPSQSQMTTGFALAQGGYKWDGTKFDVTTQYDPSATYESGIDRRGLYQFILGMGNSKTDFKFEQNEWYTISLPFNMTPDQIKTVFGANTQVCRFSKVTRIAEPEEGQNKEIRLEFRKSVMGDIESGEYCGLDYAADGIDAAGKYYGIRHHYPYMIKPSGTVDNKYIYEEDGQWHFSGQGFKRIPGTLQNDPVFPEGAGFAYDFVPILMKGKIKPNSYVLVDHGTKKHEYVFYKGTKNGDGVYVAGGTANQNTAYVQLPITTEMTDTDDAPTNIIDRGVEDLKIFFTEDEGDNTLGNGAKAVKSLFGDEEDDATAIEKVVIVCGTDGLEDNKVYTIGGQLVNGNNLPAGLYIKNGKKFIVK